MTERRNNVNLLGRGGNPEFWSDTVRNKDAYKVYRETQLKNWERLCLNEDIESLKYSEFRIYAINGNRTIFQKPYYMRRVQVETAAILALIYPEEQKYLDYCMDMIYAICNEYSWCIPAHLPNLMTVCNKTHLDLFACETAYTLAQIYALLGDRLDPLIKNRILFEVDRHVFSSFLKHNTWGWEVHNTANWAAVCAGSVGCSFMLLRPEQFYEIKPRIDGAMGRYLSGFKDDGFCLEGTHYWHYGFGFFIAYAEMLRDFSGGEYDYFKLEKVHSIATFIQKMYLSGKASVSFADAGGSLEYHIGMLHFLAKEYDDVKVFSPEYSYINDNCGRFCWLITAATWLDEELYFNPSPNNAVAEYYAKESEWLVKRTESYGFAGKAGNNNEPHNHNDVGSFIIAKDGRHMVTDPGSGAYSQQYFAKNTRYEMVECSSLGHCAPYFGDLVQKYGGEYSATPSTYENGVFSFDMAGAYGDETVKSIKRSFSFTDTTVTLTDTFDYTGDAPITDRIVAKVMPVISEGKVVIDTLTVTYDPGVCTVNTAEAVTSRGVTIYFADFVLKSGQNSITLVFE